MSDEESESESEESSEEEDDEDSDDTYLENIGYYRGQRNDLKQRHGFGKAVLPNGDTYVGNYFEGKRHGFGTYRFRRNRAQYAGNYIHNVRQGYGVMIYPDGTKYEGNWTDARKNGWGKYYYENGDTYEGEWVKDRRHGLGTYFFADSGVHHKGTWYRGIRQGDASVEFLNYTFLGNYEKNKPFGPAKFEFTNNSEAVGLFKMLPNEGDEDDEEDDDDDDEDDVDDVGEEEEEFDPTDEYVKASDYWRDKTTRWYTTQVNDLHKKPPPTMQELIDARMNVVKTNMLELDRLLALKLHPEPEPSYDKDHELKDFFGYGPRDDISKILEEPRSTSIKKDDGEEQKEDGEDEEVEECMIPTTTLAFTDKEKEMMQEKQESQPPAT